MDGSRRFSASTGKPVQRVSLHRAEPTGIDRKATRMEVGRDIVERLGRMTKEDPDWDLFVRFGLRRSPKGAPYIERTAALCSSERQQEENGSATIPVSTSAACDALTMDATEAFHDPDFFFLEPPSELKLRLRAAHREDHDPIAPSGGDFVDD